MNSNNNSVELIDQKHLAELRTTLGSRTVVRLMRAFSQNVNGEAHHITYLAAGNKWPAMRSAAHALRGVALNLGCVALAAMCSKVENSGVPEIGELLDALVVTSRLTSENLVYAIDDSC